MAASRHRPPKEHESPRHWLQDVASMFAGVKVGLRASFFLFGLVSALLAGIIVSAILRP
jgi:hypothetical protein